MSKNNQRIKYSLITNPKTVMKYRIYKILEDSKKSGNNKKQNKKRKYNESRVKTLYYKNFTRIYKKKWIMNIIQQ